MKARISAVSGIGDLILAAAAIGVLFALRLHVAPWHDLGFLVDDYVRLGAGFIPHVDYRTSIPQLAVVLQYLIHPGANDVLFYFNLFNCVAWLASAALIFLLCRLLRFDHALTALCLLLWAAAVDPAYVSHAYNHLGAVALGGATILGFLYLRHGGAISALGLGLLAAAALFAKPPFGMAAGLIGAVAILLQGLRAARPATAILRGLWLTGAGGVIGGLAAFLLVARGDPQILGTPSLILEMARQMFLDAGAAKGGVKVLLRWIPRLKVEGVLQSLPLQFIGSALAYGLATWAVWHALPGGAVAGAHGPLPPETRHRASAFVWAGASVLVTLTVAAHALEIVTAPVAGSAIIHVTRVLNNLFYLFCVALVGVGAFAFLRAEGMRALARPQNAEAALAAAAVIGAVFAVGMSSIDYVPFSGTALFPALACLLVFVLGARAAVTVLAIVLFLYLCLAGPFASYSHNGFRADCPLPRNGGGTSALAGAAPHCARFDLMEATIFPVVEDARVAWLTMPSGFAAFAGRPARGLGAVYWDAYAPRVEARVREIWEAEPPDFIVIERALDFPAGSGLAAGGNLRRWIESHYREDPASGEAYILMQRR